MSYSDLPHLRSNAASVATAAKPSVAAGAGAGSGASASLTRGTDQAGTVSVTTAGTPAAGTLATVTFATPYSVVPHAVSVDAGDVNSASGQLYATVSTTALTIKAAAVGTLVASQTLTLNYVVVGGV